MFLTKEKKSPYYQIVYSEGGKRKKYSTKTALKSEAKRMLLQFKYNFEFSGTSIRREKKVELKDPTLSEFRVEYVDYVKLSKSENYVRSIELTFEHFSRFAGNINLRAINNRLLDQFIAEVYSRAKSAANLYFRTLKAAFSKAVDWEYMNENPFKKMKPPKVIQKFPVFISKDEFNEILDKVGKPQLRDICTVAFYTGMRLAEILNMKWYWVNMNTRTITVRNSDTFIAKSKKERSIPMNQMIIKLFSNYHISNPNDYVFVKIKSAKLNEDYVSKMFKKAVRATELNADIHFHTLRHSFASNLVQRGASLYVIKELLGHADIKTTQIYSHLTGESLFDAISLL